MQNTQITVAKTGWGAARAPDYTMVPVVLGDIKATSIGHKVMSLSSIDLSSYPFPAPNGPPTQIFPTYQ
jgi:hypothetical protein